jgi:hypothetical protein
MYLLVSAFSPTCPAMSSLLFWRSEWNKNIRHTCRPITWHNRCTVKHLPWCHLSSTTLSSRLVKPMIATRQPSMRATPHHATPCRSPLHSTLAPHRFSTSTAHLASVLFPDCADLSIRLRSGYVSRLAETGRGRRRHGGCGCGRDVGRGMWDVVGRAGWSGEWGVRLCSSTGEYGSVRREGYGGMRCDAMPMEEDGGGSE